MLKDLANILYPTGSAFRVINNSDRKKIHDSVDFTLNDFFDMENSFFKSLYPDNDEITLEEFDFLSYTYGLNYPATLTYQQKKVMLLEKINRSYAAKHKQSAVYMEKVLNEYGFEVMVTENVNQEIPVELRNSKPTQHSMNVQHGLYVQHGYTNFNLIANSQNPKENYFQGVTNNWSVFFITGKGGLNEPVPISENNIVSFRELVLRLKPAHAVALFNYEPDPLSGDFNNDFNNDFLI